jgi:hypothetical protein
MAIATYADLVTEAQDYFFGRPDIAAKVPTFVRLFEAKANRALRCRQMEIRASASTNPASTSPEFLSLPSDYQSMRRLRLLNPSDVARGTPSLDFVVPAQLDMFRERDNTPADPSHFTVFGTELELYPTPLATVTYNFEMIYRANIPPLDGVVNTTNWLLTLAPDTYLYGTLLEASPWLLGDERIPVWASAVKDAFDGLNLLSDDATYNAGPLIIRRRKGGY